MRRFAALLLLAPLAACAGRPPRPPRSVVVFFSQWSAALDPAARKVIDQAAAAAKAAGDSTVRVIGFADPVGSRAANLELSRLRAQVVVDRLVADGVRSGRIVKSGRGPTNYQMMSQESRRVEIKIAGQ